LTPLAHHWVIDGKFTSEFDKLYFFLLHVKNRMNIGYRILNFERLCLEEPFYFFLFNN